MLIKSIKCLLKDKHDNRQYFTVNFPGLCVPDILNSPSLNNYSAFNKVLLRHSLGRSYKETKKY